MIVRVFQRWMANLTYLNIQSGEHALGVDFYVTGAQVGQAETGLTDKNSCRCFAFVWQASLQDHPMMLIL